MSVYAQLLSLPPLSSLSSVKDIFGSVFIGAFLSFSLYGLFVNQTYTYFRLYKTDAPWLKIIVRFLSVLNQLCSLTISETVVSALHLHLGYYYFVENYGNPLAFISGVFPVVSASIMINCQSFYTVRILLGMCNFGPSKFRVLLVIVVVSLMCGAMASHIDSCVLGVSIGMFRGITLINFNNFLWLALSYNVLASAADVILTTTLIYILHRSRTGFKSTDSMINKLILIFNIISFVLVHIYGVGNWSWLGTMMIAERRELNSRKLATKKRENDNVTRPAELYGTAVRASTLRFNRSSGMGEAIELSQVHPDMIEVDERRYDEEDTTTQLGATKRFPSWPRLTLNNHQDPLPEA
ncbi:hypothetical protein BD310DRAFT_931022 [Dichomitus squalens]|uniref:Uncharacterized protein n=1 Tax=Dichomitus squalens TaxID=114155 RepID=A0A4Q9PQJ0_9APHY|nr:hypothetical protein BD310DRAFT_931022 [Dichomitus squalens]